MSGFTQSIASVEAEDVSKYMEEMNRISRLCLENKEEPIVQAVDPVITIGGEEGTTEAQETNSNAGKDSKCNECGKIKNENAQLRHHLKSTQEEVNTFKSKQTETPVCEECKNTCDNLKKVEEQLALSQVAHNEAKTNLEKSQGELDEKKGEIVQLKSENQELKSKLDELNVDESNPVNMRLKEFCVQLQKDKLKLIIAHNKEKKELEKAKMDADDNLKAAILENKDLKVRDDTLMGIYSCLQNVLNKKVTENESQEKTTDVPLNSGGKDGIKSVEQNSDVYLFIGGTCPCHIA